MGRVKCWEYPSFYFSFGTLDEIQAMRNPSVWLHRLMDRAYNYKQWHSDRVFLENLRRVATHSEDVDNIMKDE